MNKLYITLGAAALAMVSALPTYSFGPQRAPGLEGRSGMKRIDKLGNSKYDNADGHDLREVPTEGKLKCLVVLVEFQDTRFTVSDDPRQTIDMMLNQPGFNMAGATGSAFDFYHTTSFGQFSPEFDVFGPVLMDKPEVDYVKSDETYIHPVTGKETPVYPAGRMVEEAVRKLDGQVNFADYDSNGDGMVDFVYLFFAGRGVTTGGSQDSTIWPHASTLTSTVGAAMEVDGVTVDRYVTSGEIGSNGALSGIGTFCHEMAHVLGLPDLYDTASQGTVSKCFTPGPYSCMDSGNYNNDEHTPPLFSAYERYALEWMCPVTMSGGGEFTLLPVGANNFAYKVAVSGKDTEYFLLENRGGGLYDSYLPTGGLMVWHIDYNAKQWNENCPNNEPTHQRIDLIEADNDQSSSASSRAGDLFPGNQSVCEYLSSVSPTFLSWDNKPTGYEITNIRRYPDGALSMTVGADSGEVMEGSAIERPEITVTRTSTDYADLAITLCEGASSYRVSVYDLASFDGAQATRFAADYWFKDVTDEMTTVDGKGHVQLTGLKPGSEYGVAAYAMNGVNAARNEIDVTLRTQSDNFTDAFTRVNGTTVGKGTVHLDWDTVRDAEFYEGVMAETVPGEKIGETGTSFDEAAMPEGWQGTGRYDNRANYSGESAPSYCLGGVGTWLETARQDSDIAEVTFWGRQRFSGAEGMLDLYSVSKSGLLTHVGRIGSLGTKGETCTVKLPLGVRQLRMVYTPLATSLEVYVDDITMTLAGDPMRGGLTRAFTSPDAEYDLTELDADTTYGVQIRACKGDEESAWSELFIFVPSQLPQGSGVETLPAEVASDLFSVNDGVLIPTDSSMVYDLYDAAGRAVALGARGAFPIPAHGLYIAVTAQGSCKVMR